MKVIALGSGTSQGVPVIGCTCEVCLSNLDSEKRLRSAVFIKSEKAEILIDIGPDFRTQFLENQLNSTDLVLITHEHNDHIIGLDDIRAINYTQNKSIPIYASERVGNEIKKRFQYIFSEQPYPGLPRINLNIIDNSSFTFKDITITPIELLHGSLPIWGYRLNDFVYITDASKIIESEYRKLTDVKVLIINALRREPHHSHFTLSEALETIKKINPQQAYLTHISHNLGLTAQWSKDLPANVSPLKDKMIIEV